MIGFEEWNSRLRSNCGHYYGEPSATNPPNVGRFEVTNRHGIDVVDIRCTIRRIHRDRTGIRRDDAEHLFLLVQKRGETRVTHCGREERLTPGEYMLLDSTVPAELAYDDRSVEFLSAHLPRTLCLEGQQDRVRTGHKIAASHPLIPNFRRLLTSDVWDTPNETGIDFLKDLIGMAFGQAGPCSDAARIKDRRHRYGYVISMIDQHLTDADLTLDRLSSMVHLSRRQLQREFSNHGTSFSAYLRCKRLKYVAEHLRAAARLRQVPNISGLAYRAGFGDLSHFNRSFRQRYGAAPREFLNETERRLRDR